MYRFKLFLEVSPVGTNGSLVVLSGTGPVWVDFSFSGIDELKVTGSCTYLSRIFAMDNFIYTIVYPNLQRCLCLVLVYWPQNPKTPILWQLYIGIIHWYYINSNSLILVIIIIYRFTIQYS